MGSNGKPGVAAIGKERKEASLQRKSGTAWERRQEGRRESWFVLKTSQSQAQGGGQHAYISVVQHLPAFQSIPPFA